MKKQLVDAIAEVREGDALRLSQEMLDSETDPTIILDACSEGMSIVGKLYEEKEYFLPELLLAGDMLRNITDMVMPKLKSGGHETRYIGKVVIGTVAGDVHDVGKDMVSFMLQANEFEVHDLGVDVSATAFIEAIQETKPEVVALSGFLTLAFDEMKNTVKAFEEAGLRDSIKVIIGGAPMDDAIKEYVGADAYGLNAAAAVKLAKAFVGSE